MEKCSFCDQYRSPTKFPAVPAKVPTSVGTASFGSINEIDWDEVRVEESDDDDDDDVEEGYIKEKYLETAPFDGDYLLYTGSDTGWVEGKWDQEAGEWDIMRGDAQIYDPENVTHWTNLPKDPS